MSTAPLIAPVSGKTFPLPSAGQQQATLAEVRDLGINPVTSTFGGVTKTEQVRQILFRWQLSELDKETKEPLRIYEKFRFSMHPKAKLYARIVGMFGAERLPPADYDFRKLEGYNFNLLLVHNQGKDGKTYANIVGTVKLAPGVAKLEIVKIADAKSKTPVAATTAPAARPATEADPIDDSSIPF